MGLVRPYRPSYGKMYCFIDSLAVWLLQRPVCKQVCNRSAYLKCQIWIVDAYSVTKPSECGIHEGEDSHEGDQIGSDVTYQFHTGWGTRTGSLHDVPVGAED